MDINSLDFQQARIKQVVFKSRLRSVLYGVREPDPSLFSPQDNPFGQWLATTLVPRFGPLPAVRTLERTFHQMLLHGQDLVRAYQQGRIEYARAGLEQVETYAAQIDALLQQIEANSGA